MNKRLALLGILFGLLAAVGCGGIPTLEDEAISSSPTESTLNMDDVLATKATKAASTDPARVGGLWARSCALCHVDGNGGAPVVGDSADWSERLAQGRELMLQRTLEGHNNMPPLGYCMSCEAADFEALIDFMTVGVTKEDRGE